MKNAITPYQIILGRLLVTGGLIAAILIAATFLTPVSGVMITAISMIFAINVVELVLNKIFAKHPRLHLWCQPVLTGGAAMILFMLSLLEGPTMLSMACGQAG